MKKIIAAITLGILTLIATTATIVGGTLLLANPSFGRTVYFFTLLALIVSVIFLATWKNGARKVIKFFSIWLGVILLILIGFATKEYFFEPHWSAFFYLTSNGGLDPEIAGPYWNKKECEEKASAALRSQTVKVTEKPAEAYFCGNFCYEDFIFRGPSYLDEFHCLGEDPPKLE
jgi:hypothetical protein